MENILHYEGLITKHGLFESDPRRWNKFPFFSLLKTLGFVWWGAGLVFRCWPFHSPFQLFPPLTQSYGLNWKYSTPDVMAMESNWVVKKLFLISTITKKGNFNGKCLKIEANLNLVFRDRCPSAVLFWSSLRLCKKASLFRTTFFSFIILREQKDTFQPFNYNSRQISFQSHWYETFFRGQSYFIGAIFCLHNSDVDIFILQVKVHLKITIEGVVHEKVFEADPNIRYTYSWDRLNEYRQVNMPFL